METQRLGPGLYRVVRTDAERRAAYTLTRAALDAIAARLPASVAQELRVRYDQAMRHEPRRGAPAEE